MDQVVAIARLEWRAQEAVCQIVHRLCVSADPRLAYHPRQIDRRGRRRLHLEHFYHVDGAVIDATKDIVGLSVYPRAAVEARLRHHHRRGTRKITALRHLPQLLIRLVADDGGDEVQRLTRGWWNLLREEREAREVLPLQQGGRGEPKASARPA